MKKTSVRDADRNQQLSHAHPSLLSHLRSIIAPFKQLCKSRQPSITCQIMDENPIRPSRLNCHSLRNFSFIQDARLPCGHGSICQRHAVYTHHLTYVTTVIINLFKIVICLSLGGFNDLMGQIVSEAIQEETALLFV